MSAFCPACGAEYLDSVHECADCQVALVPADDDDAGGRHGIGANEDDAGDEVVYELEDWEPDLLDQLNHLLAREGIAHQWEGNRNLVVREVDSEKVDDLLDELEFIVEDEDERQTEPGMEDEYEEGEVGGGRDGEGDEDEGSYDAVSDLFVAADRLAGTPDDVVLCNELVQAVEAVDSSRAPFGFAPEEWEHIRAMSASVRDDVASGASQEVTAQDARALRDLLRRYV